MKATLPDTWLERNWQLVTTVHDLVAFCLLLGTVVLLLNHPAFTKASIAPWIMPAIYGDIISFSLVLAYFRRWDDCAWQMRALLVILLRHEFGEMGII